MDEQFSQYRFARTEGQKTTEAELATQFKDGIKDLHQKDLHQLEQAIEQLLTKQAAPWRTTDLEQEGFREASAPPPWSFTGITASRCDV